MACMPSSSPRRACTPNPALRRPSRRAGHKYFMPLVNHSRMAWNILALTEGKMLFRREHGSRDTASGTRDEAYLVTRIAGGDLRAFEALYRIYYPRVRHFLNRFVRSPERVEEALDDTMMVVWTRAGSYDGNSKVSTWIFGIAYRKGLKILSRADEPVEDGRAAERESEEEGPEQRLGRIQVRARLEQAMAELGANHRAVVDLAYFHEMGYREIAEVMDCPVDTVKTRMFHARRTLRSHLAGKLADWL